MSESSTATLTRTVEGVEVPQPGTYVIDPSHSHVGFSVRHLMVSRVRGAFHESEGQITVAEAPLESSVEVAVGLASIDTRDEQRDGHLRSADFFDTDKHPKMTFRSTGVRSQGEGRYLVDGELTLRDVTRPVTLDVTYEGAVVDPWGNDRIGFSATTEIDRDEFGVSWNQALETGGVVVGKKVRIEIEAEAVRQR